MFEHVTGRMESMGVSQMNISPWEGPSEEPQHGPQQASRGETEGQDGQGAQGGQGVQGGEAEMPEVRDLDRDESWLRFNERVLELAEDESVPLLERVRFLT